MTPIGYFELMGFGPNGWGPLLLAATGMTIAVSLCGFLLGIVFGAISAWAKLGHAKVPYACSVVYIDVVRGVPELLIIYLFYFGTSRMVTTLSELLGNTEAILVPAFAIGVLSLGILGGAYLAEVFRGAYLALHKGELEAARSVGMHSALMFRRIIIPQVLRYAVPGMGNVWLMILKESALISVTGLVEILRQADVAGRSTRQPFSFFITAAILYLLIAAFSGRLFQMLESWSMRGMRRAAR